MKSIIKSTILAAGIALLAVPGSFAQASTAPEQTPAPAASHPARSRLARRAMLRRRLARALGLTDAQKAQLKTVHANTRATVKAIRADASLTPDQKKSKIRETLMAARAEMRGVLTSDQQAKLDEIRARHRQAEGL